jgi:hypothetical protein
MTAPETHWSNQFGKEEAVRSVLSSIKHLRYVLGSLSAVMFAAAVAKSL